MNLGEVILSYEGQDVYRDDWYTAEEVSNAYPDLYKIPTQEDVHHIDIGDNLRIGCPNGCMWVYVIGYNGWNKNHLLCRIEHFLLMKYPSNYQYGSYVLIEPKHALAVLHVEKPVSKIRNLKDWLYRKDRLGMICDTYKEIFHRNTANIAT